MAANPLRAPPRPFIKREIKKEVRKTHTAPAPVADETKYKEYALRACNEEDLEGFRTHILKFQSKAKVDPAESFTKPIRLHRKETKNLQYQLTRAEIEQRQRELAEQRRIEEEQEALKREQLEGTTITLTEEELKRIAPEPEPEQKTEEEKRLEKQEKQLAHIAPDGGARKNKNPFKKKTRRINAINEDAKKLRYEEYYPWVMEDYDGKNTWVGSYEAGGSDTYVLLICDENGFKMVPADKFYKFTPRNKYSTLTLEEAEARMEKNQTMPRWLMKHLEPEEQKLTRYERTRNKLRTVVGTGGNEDRGDRDSDNDDLDFEEDFADDEEAPIIDGDEEENKESERRIKREMQSANAMGLHDEEEDVDDLFEIRKVDKEGERLRKALVKTDMSGMYESDEEINPYLSASDLEMSKSDEEDLIKADLSKQITPIPTTRKGSPSPGVRQIKVVSVNNPIGYVVLKALPSVLIKFPKGEWNPNAQKRAIEQTSGSDTEDSRSTKRVKISDSPVKIETESSGGSVPDGSSLINENDILEIVKNERITAKDLIRKVKNKLSQHPDNKSRLKTLVKQLLKKEDGFFVLKN